MRIRQPCRSRVGGVSGIAYIGLYLAMGQDDVRPQGISSVMPGTERGYLAWATLASDVSGSPQVNLRISAGKAHLI